MNPFLFSSLHTSVPSFHLSSRAYSFPSIFVTLPWLNSFWEGFFKNAYVLWFQLLLILCARDLKTTFSLLISFLTLKGKILQTKLRTLSKVSKMQHPAKDHQWGRCLACTGQRATGRRRGRLWTQLGISFKEICMVLLSIKIGKSDILN